MTESGAVSAGDIAQTNPRLGDKRKKKDEDKKQKTTTGDPNMKMIKETEDYKFYETSKGYRVFEFINENDHQSINLGFQKRNFRYWRQTLAGAHLLEIMQTERGKAFVVKCGNREFNPFALGM